MTLTALSVLLGCGGADKVSGVQPSGVKTLTLANGNENQSLLSGGWLHYCPKCRTAT